MKEIYDRLLELNQNLIYIRDLARTGTPPSAHSMTLEAWNRYKLEKIAGMLDLIVSEDIDYE